MLKIPINRENFQIETERLLLVSIELSHDQEIFKEFDKDVTTYMTPTPPDKIEDTQEFIKSWIQKNTEQKDAQLVILKKDTKEFIWCIWLHKIDTTIPEFWIRTKKSSHGNKYGQEAIQWLYKRAQANIEAEYITYPVDHRNIASCKLPQSLWWTTDWIISSEDTFDPNRKLEIIRYKIEL